MNRLRVLVCCVSLVIALAPLAAFADESTSHEEDEVANAEAQLAIAEQDASNMQAEAQQSAANDRMIALLKSEAMRQLQLHNVANGNAIEQIAAALANAARAQGEVNAQNELIIAQNKAAVLIATADANLANAQVLAQEKGRYDELQNAQAQSTLLHQAADVLTSTIAEANMANARQIAQDEADAIHTPGIAEQQNSEAMGAEELLASDTDLEAGELSATSDIISSQMDQDNVLSHALGSLHNEDVKLADAEAAGAP
jgi:hypothetical protein